MSLGKRFGAIPGVRKGFERFGAMEPRDRLAAKSLAIFVAGVVAYFGMWLPLHTFSTDARSDRNDNRDLYTWMMATRQQAVTADRGAGAELRARSGQTLLTRVSRTAQQNQIQPNRLQPEGQNVSVWFDAVAFNSLMRWLQDLERKEGISVQSISVDRQDKPGLVNARIVLRS